MTTSENKMPVYREVALPGLGQIQVPAHLTDAEILAEVLGDTAQATPTNKIQKKP